MNPTELTLEEEILESLKADKEVNCMLPGGSRLYFDRPLPFLCFYRLPAGNVKTAEAGLLTTQPAYLLLSETDIDLASDIIQQLIKALSKRFGAFLLVEIWQEAHDTTSSFKLYSPKEGEASLSDSLLKHLESSEWSLYHKPKICKKSPADKFNLISSELAEKVAVQQMGIGIKPVYSKEGKNQLYPMVYRRFRQFFGTALRQFFFDFVRIQTKYKVAHYNGLGRQKEGQLVWDIDQELAEISSCFDFLMLTSVANHDEAWQEFSNSGFNKKPNFRYRFVPFDPELVKRRLYNIKIEEVEDPTLAFIFRDKRLELDKMLTMLCERNTPNFKLTGIQVFGGAEEELVNTANSILSATQELEKAFARDKKVSTREFVALAEAEVAYLKSQYQSVDAKVCIRNDISSLMVSQGQFYVKEGFTTTEARARALIQHEVGTHVLTYYNGKAQPLKQMFVGTPGYEDLQEGLAVLSEYLVDGLNPNRLRTLAARVIAVQCMLNGASFIDTFRKLHKDLGFTARSSYNVTERIFRGGGMSKDSVYLRGLIHLLKYLASGGKIEPLLVGKIKQDYIPFIDELIERKILKTAPILPRYLIDNKAQKRLKQLREKPDVLSLIKIL